MKTTCNFTFLAAAFLSFLGSGSLPAKETTDPTGEGNLNLAGTVALSQESLATITQAAARRWIESGISAELQATLTSVNYQIADLGGNTIAQTQGTTITIDDDAGGWGWFIDQTPQADEEFSQTDDLAETAEAIIYGIVGTEAAGRYDLLTTVLHEQGHVLGADHSENDLDLMFDLASVGVRKLPTGEIALDPSGSVEGAYSITPGSTINVDENVGTAFVVADINFTLLNGEYHNSFSLSGTDANDFSIDSSGRIRFVSDPDFENPSDGNMDNTYQFTVNGSGGFDDFNGRPQGRSDSSNFTIIVEDVVEAAAGPADLYSSGAKTWNTSLMNWGTVSGGPYNTATWNNAAPDSAIFEGTAGTVTLDVPINIGDLNINTANYKITGSTLAFTGGITVAASGVTIESGITGNPIIDQTGGNNMNLDPIVEDMHIGEIVRDADNFIDLGGSTTGNTLGTIIKSPLGGNVRNQKLDFDGTGKWTLLGDVYAGEMYIKSGEVVANGELTADFRGIYIQNTGILHWNNPGAIKGPTNGDSNNRKFLVQGGSIDNTSGAAITTSDWNPRQEWSGSWTFIGSGGANSDLNMGNGAVGLVSNVQVTVTNAATTLTAGGAVTDGGGGYGITKAGPGTLALPGSHNYTGLTTISAGTLILGDGTNNGNLSDDSVLEIANGATLNANWDAGNVDTVFGLTFDGVLQASGTWGSTASSATNKDARITGTGIINNVGGVYNDGSFRWEGSNTGGTGNGLADGGTGTWDTTTLNWDRGFVAREAWPNDTSSKAIIAGPAGTITLGSDITLGELIIDSTADPNYKITGGTLNFGGTKFIDVDEQNVTIESGITGNPTIDQTGGNNMNLDPIVEDMHIGEIVRDADNYIDLGGSTTGNTLGTIIKSSGGGNVKNQKLDFDGSGKWTLLGDVYAGEMYIKSGEVVANGELTADFRGIYIQNTGILHWNNPGAIKGPTNGDSNDRKFLVQGGSIDNTSGAAITTSTWNPRQEWGGNWTFIGSNGANSDLYLGTGAVGLTGTRQVTVQNAATTLSVGGIISGSNAAYGLTKAGDGTLLLNGINTYSGLTTVSAGALGGTGTITGDVLVNANASLAPGASVGTLTVNGDLDITDMAAGPGTLDFELNNIAASDLIAVGGTLTIGSAQLGFSDFAFADLGGMETGVYTLISTPTAIIGTLNTGDTTGMVGARFVELQVGDGGTDLELVVFPLTATATSITRIGAAQTNSTSVSWDVTFDVPVSGLTASNFALTGDLAGTSTIDPVSDAGSSTDWVVTASTGGCGTLGLSLNDGTGTTPPISNAPFPTVEGPDQVYQIDTDAPVISCAKQIVVTVEEGSTATVSYAPTAWDECEGASVPVVCDPPSPGTFAIGNHVVECTATDSAGNIGTASFNVVVLEQQPVNGERFLEGISVRGDEVAAGTGIGPDAVILGIGSAFLNDGGDVVFDATLQNNGANSSAVFFRPDGGSPSPVAVKGNSFGAGAYGNFSNLSLNDAGGIGFQSLTSGNLPGHFAGPGTGPVANSALRLGAAPTGVAGEVYNGLYQPALASNGELLTPAALLLGGGGVSSTSDTLITSSAGTVLAREGSATGTGDLTHGQFLARVVASDADGHYAFPSLVFGSTPAGGNAGIFVGQLGGGSPSIAVRKGDAAADTPGTFGSFLGESVNSSGEIALRAFAFGGGVTASDNEGIWTNSGNASAPPVLVAREGDVTPCIGEGLIAFGSFKTVYMGDDGSVCFLAYLRDATTTPAVFPSNDASIWLWRNGVLDLIVREGDIANSTDSCTIARLVDFDSNGDADGGNGIVYSVDFVPGIGDATTRTNQAVYVDRGGEDLAPVLVLRRGDSFDDGEDESDILSLRISTATSPSGSTGGLGRAINGDGDVLLNVGFTGSRSGIFVLSSPPE